MLDLAGKRFSFDKAYAMLGDLETNLPPLNEFAIDDLKPHLGDMTVHELAEGIAAGRRTLVFTSAR